MRAFISHWDSCTILSVLGTVDREATASATAVLKVAKTAGGTAGELCQMKIQRWPSWQAVTKSAKVEAGLLLVVDSRGATFQTQPVWAITPTRKIKAHQAGLLISHIVFLGGDGIEVCTRLEEAEGGEVFCLILL